jgi:hypothetical protein
MPVISPNGRRYDRIKDVVSASTPILPFARKFVLLPPAVEYMGYCGPIKSQQNEGSCTGHMASSAVEWIERKYGKNKNAVLSPQDVYANELIMDGDFPRDNGSSLGTACKVLTSLGVCPESAYPYQSGQIEMPTQDQKDQALQYKMGAYHRLTGSRQVISCLGDPTPWPVLVGFDVTEALESDVVAKTGVYAPSGAVIGGHAVLCLSGNTKIPLLDGRELTFIELEKEFKDRGFWVYSCGPRGAMVPGFAHSPRKTGTRPTLNVAIDNGEVIECTHDHLFMMRDGSYQPAEMLVAGDSLMPLYREVDNSGYEKLFCPRSDEWYFTHRAMAVSMFGPYEGVIHHVNFDKRNNTPPNLRPMSWVDHTQLHAENTLLLESYAKSDRGRNNSRVLMASHWSDPEWRMEALRRASDNGRRVSEQLKSENRCGFQAFTKERLSASGKRYGIANISRPLTKESRDKIGSTHRHKMIEEPEYRAMKSRIASINISEHNRKLALGLTEISQSQRAARSDNAKKLNAQRWKTNHKVVGVSIGKVMDVYDLTVEKYHNFALSSGVFVHNCVGYDVGDPILRPANTPPSVLIQNSWGASWGLGGFFWMPLSVIDDPSTDLWITHSGKPWG